MTESSTLTFQGDVVKCSVPRSLYLSIARIQVEEGIDWNEACRKSAELMNTGSKEFSKRVAQESRRLYDSALMKQLNKARKSVRNSGYSRGYESGRKDHQLWYYCSVCGQGIWLTPNSDSHKALISYMKERGWGHASCHSDS